MMENVVGKITEVCANASGNVYDVFYVLYKECFENQENSEVLLRKIIEKAQQYDFDIEGEPQYIDMSEIDRIENVYYDLLQKYVRTLVLKNFGEEKFYELLYKNIFINDIFPREEKTQAILLYWLAQKTLMLPYFAPQNLVEMTGEEYKETVKHLAPCLNKMINILNRHYLRRTEEASQIYEIMSQIENEKDRVVFLAVLINVIQKQEK